MATPYYLEAPKGEEFQPSFLDRVGSGLSRAWDETPPEAFFALAQSLSRPGPFVRNLTEGLGGLGTAISASKKRKGMAEALKGMAGQFTPQQQQFFDLVGPEQALPFIGGSLFGKPNEQTSDIQNYKFAVDQGFGGSYFDFKKQLALAGAGNQGSVNIPGVGDVDKYGKVDPGVAPPGAPPPQLRPSLMPSALETDTASTGEQIGGIPPMAAEAVPQPAPQSPATKYRPILGPQQERLGLPTAPQGQQWVYGADFKPALVGIEGFKTAPTALPAEIGARIGLAEGFLRKYQGIATRLKKLETLKGRAQLAVDTGEGAEIRRDISTGAEALIRQLTGAGKSIQEATEYASRYIPGPLDTAFDLSSKLKGLRYDLENSIGGTMRDRGGWTSPARDPEMSKEDLEFTAKKHGITVEEVKRRLKDAR